MRESRDGAACGGVETQQAVFVCEIHEMINGSRMAENRLVK